MKVTIDIDFTPLEARQFLGLPDVQPLQTAVMTKIEKRVMAEAERFSPEGLIGMWLSPPQGAEWLRDLFGGLRPPEASKGSAAARIRDAKEPTQG